MLYSGRNKGKIETELHWPKLNCSSDSMAGKLLKSLNNITDNYFAGECLALPNRAQMLKIPYLDKEVHLPLPRRLCLCLFKVAAVSPITLKKVWTGRSFG